MPVDQAPWWVAAIAIPGGVFLGWIVREIVKAGTTYVRETITEERGHSREMTQRLISLQEHLLNNSISERQGWLSVLQDHSEKSKENYRLLERIAAVEDRIQEQNVDLIRLMTELKEEIADLRLVQTGQSPQH